VTVGRVIVDALAGDRQIPDDKVDGSYPNVDLAAIAARADGELRLHELFEWVEAAASELPGEDQLVNARPPIP
jgi:hypothetical protein